MKMWLVRSRFLGRDESGIGFLRMEDLVKEFLMYLEAVGHDSGHFVKKTVYYFCNFHGFFQVLYFKFMISTCLFFRFYIMIK